MRRPKLSWRHVLVIGVVIGVIMGAGLFFGLIRPARDAVATLQGEVDSLDGQVNQPIPDPGGAGQYATAPEFLVAKQQELDQKSRELANALARKSPPGNVNVNLGDNSPIARMAALDRYWRLPQWVGPTMERFVERNAARHNITIEAPQFTVPSLTTNPAQIPDDIIAWNLGSVTGSGAFLDLMRWAEDFNTAPLLTTADGITLNLVNNDGDVSTTAAITVFIFPRLNPGVAPAGTATGGSGAGGSGGALPF